MAAASVIVRGIFGSFVKNGGNNDNMNVKKNVPQNKWNTHDDKSSKISASVIRGDD